MPANRSAEQPEPGRLPRQNEAAAGLVAIKTTDVTCSYDTRAHVHAMTTDSPGTGGTVYVAVTGQFKTIMGGITFNLGTTAVGRIVRAAAVRRGSAQTITLQSVPTRRSEADPSRPSQRRSGLAVTFTTTTPSVCGSSGTNGSGDLAVRRSARASSSRASQAMASGQQPPNAQQAFQVPPPPPPTPPTRRSRSRRSAIGCSAAVLRSPARPRPPAPVTFTTTTPTICASAGPDGSTITLLAVGMCTVQADQRPATVA